MIGLRRMIWKSHVVRMGKKGSECGVSVGSYLEEVDILVHVSVELNGTLMTLDGMMWTGFVWLRIRTIDRQM
jgi:hypothetical protein